MQQEYQAWEVLYRYGRLNDPIVPQNQAYTPQTPQFVPQNPYPVPQQPTFNDRLENELQDVALMGVRWIAQEMFGIDPPKKKRRKKAK